jgi:hypothetical protein
MAFLKETNKSLRMYFILVGIISAFIGIQTIGDMKEISALVVPGSWKAVIYYQTAMSLGLGVGYVIAGATLQAALRKGAGWIKAMLVASIGLLILNAILINAVLPTAVMGGGMGGVVGGSLIALYLLHNIKRLSHEAQNPPPPTVA